MKTKPVGEELATTDTLVLTDENLPVNGLDVIEFDVSEKGGKPCKVFPEGNTAGADVEETLLGEPNNTTGN